MKFKAKRLVSVVLTIIMVLSCMSASFSFFAEAAEWKFIGGGSYEPVTIYVNTGATTMTNGKTYRLALANKTTLIDADNPATLTTAATSPVRTQPTYYTSDDGSDVLYTTTDYYNATDVGSDFVWNNGTLYNEAKQQYLVNNSTRTITMSATSATWTNSSNTLSMYLSSRTRYIRNTSSTTINLGTSNDASAFIYFYEKVTVYEKTGSGSGEGAYYKYDGQTAFTVLKDSTFSDTAIRDQIRVLHKTDESTPDANCDVYTIENDEITLTWNEAVDTSTEGDYTATVYACGVALETITVTVREQTDPNTKAADPSTSDIEDDFALTSAEDGKVTTDKTVRYNSDEYSAFTDYEKDEFSVALSALGQSFPTVETFETFTMQKLHPDVVFCIDASGSMRVYTVAGSTTVTRGQATIEGLNEAIKQLYAADPLTRIGIVTFSNDYEEEGIYLPLDVYRLPEGQTDYVTWGGRMVASSTAPSGKTSTKYDDLSLAVRTTSSATSVSPTKLTSPPGYTGSGTTYSWANPAQSSMTKLTTTADGTTYYAYTYSYYNTTYYMCLYSDKHQMPIARLQYSPESAYYTNVYKNEYITVTATGTSTLSYTTNTYTNKTGAYAYFETVDYMGATNFLINSKGEVVAPSARHFIGNMATYTQAGLQAVENMYSEADGKTGRAPAIVLISDGVPTLGNTDVNNPSLEHIPVGTSGSTCIGTGASSATYATTYLVDCGFYTIQTAMKVKSNVNNMYTATGARDCLLYTIGPGVDYIFGKTVLDPSAENVAAAALVTSADDSESESGVAVPSELAARINEAYSDLTYVDYSDWSFLGEMSSSELTTAFRKVITSISGNNTPVQNIIKTVAGAGEIASAIDFTDTIGDGMYLRSEPILRFQNQNYTSTSNETTNKTDGTSIIRYRYAYTLKDDTTSYNLDTMTVTVTTRTDGTQVVKWYIPADLLPLIIFDSDSDAYVSNDPVRLLYKVGLTDEAKDAGGFYYTNSTDEPASAEYTPVVGDPYYYNNAEGSDGVAHSILKTNLDSSENKTQNVTETATTSIDTTVSTDGEAVSELGNNGIIEYNYTKLRVTKVWDDGQDMLNYRPDSINVVVYCNGAAYGDPVTLTAANCEVGTDANGNDTWEYVIRELPSGDDLEYTVGEITVNHYQTSVTYSADGDATITNAIPSGTLSYELYLVDENGTPITPNGTATTFENRTVMSDLVTVKQYVDSTKTIDLDELQAILPKGYLIYNTDASFTETFNTLSSGTATISDTTSTTKVFYPAGASTGANGVVNGITDYSDVKVAFAIKRIGINPDVVVLDYGKTIFNEPMLNDTDLDGYKIDGILATAPVSGVTTKDSVKLNNGVATVQAGSGKLPDGTMVASGEMPTGSTVRYFYYTDSPITVSTTNTTSKARYAVNASGALVKYAANSTTGTTLMASMSDDSYYIDQDESILFYVSGTTMLLYKNYKSDRTETTTEKEVTETVTEEIAINARVSSTQYEDLTTLFTYNGVTYRAWYGSRYSYLYDQDNNQLTSFSSNGKSYTISGTEYTITRTSLESLTCVYPKTTTKTVTEVTETPVFTSATPSGVYYSPFKYMSSIDTVYYYVSPEGTSNNTDSASDELLYSTITFIPATTVYYEDDFGGSAENGGLYIQYTGDWYTVDDNGNQTAGLAANTDTDDRQDRGEVGEGHIPYGYDSSYDDCIDFSNGSAAVVEGSVSLNPTTKKPQFDATAQFTFTGTGFDIISRTDMDCGMITVYVTDENGKSVNVPVINKGTENLYQIPVISFDCANYFDNAYGTYTVKINVNAPVTALGITGSTFYLDAIRIYNPMGLSSEDNDEFDEANDAYNTDHEANAYVASIRDYILQAGKLDETEQYGAVYVDTINNEYSGGGMIDDKDYDAEEEESEEAEETETEESDVSGMETLNYRVLNQSMIKDFELIGPNEEVYLSPGYGVGFIVETTKEPASVQLEMKIPAPIETGASLSVYTYGKTTNIGKIEINSATEMFYDITKDVIFTEADGKYRAVVVLENGLPSTDAGEIVSITNLKLTYDNDVVALDAADEEAMLTFDSYDEENVAVTSLKASWNTYEDVFDSVYTHRVASTPSYEIASVEAADTTANGKTVTATVKTSRYVEDLVIRDANGNVVKPVSIKSELDESKILTDDYKEAKTWTVSFKVYGLNGNKVDYTIESANGDGEVSTVEFEINNVAVTNVVVYKNPKTSYKAGESFDSEGMSLKVTYSDGTEKIVSSGYSTEDVEFTKAGTYKVKVYYGGEETTVTVKVKRTFKSILRSLLGRLFK